MQDKTAQQAYVGIGANLDRPDASVRRAIAAVASLPGTRMLSSSSLYQTAPVGYLDQPDFVNAAVHIETHLAPADLLEHLLQIEAQFGRKRTIRNAPRTLDLDLLLYADQSVALPQLTLPHPRMAQRAFVLVPLAEIAPDVAVGDAGTVAQLLGKMSTEGVRLLGEADGLLATGAS